MSRAQPPPASLAHPRATNTLFAHPPNIPYVRTYVCAIFPSLKREKQGRLEGRDGPRAVSPATLADRLANGGGPREREHAAACSAVT